MASVQKITRGFEKRPVLPQGRRVGRERAGDEGDAADEKLDITTLKKAYDGAA